MGVNFGIRIVVQTSECLPDNKLSPATNTWTKSYCVGNANDITHLKRLLPESGKTRKYLVDLKKVRTFCDQFSLYASSLKNLYVGKFNRFYSAKSYFERLKGNPYVQLSFYDTGNGPVDVKLHDIANDPVAGAIRDLIYEKLTHIVIEKSSQGDDLELYPVFNIYDEILINARKEEFRWWMVEVDGKSAKTAKDTANNYVPSISDELKKADAGVWRGIREYLYGEKPSKRIYEVESYAELMQLYGGLDLVFSKELDFGTFNHSRMDECHKWAHNPANHNSISAGWALYKKFMQWHDSQNEDKGDGINVERRYWLIAPGENAKFWEDWTKSGVATIGWSFLGDLKDQERAAIQTAIDAEAGDGKSHTNNSLCCWQFSHEMASGDVIIAKRGTGELLGLGFVDGDYSFGDACGNHKHYRKVRWIKTGVFTSKVVLDRKTLTDITPYPDYLMKILESMEIDPLTLENHNKPEQPVEPPKVDKLGIALKLFNEARQNGSSDLTPANARHLFEEYLKKNSGANERSIHNYAVAIDRGLQVKSALDTVVKEGIKSRSLFEIVDADEFAAEVERIKNCKSFEEFNKRYLVTHVYNHYLAFLRSMAGSSGSTNTNQIAWGCKEVRDWFGDFSKDNFEEEFHYFRATMIWSKFVRGQVGHNYEHVSELGALLAELKDSPRPINYYASDEVRSKYPEGIGVKTVTDFLMKFHPESYISFTNNMMDALEVLGLWNHNTKREIDISYNELIGQATRVRNRMTEMEIGAYPECNKPKADYLTVNEFLWWVSVNKDLIKEKVMAMKMKDVQPTKYNGARKPLNLNAEDKDDELLLRLLSALRAKPFAILAGHSGTGKSRYVKKLAYMTCDMEELRQGKLPGNYLCLQVKPNWHDSTDLLVFRNAMSDNEYQKTALIEFLFRAYHFKDTPFFLCLDEMNLAPVEQYFAEFLSSMESEEPLPLNDIRAEEDNLFELGCEWTDAKKYLEDNGFSIPKNLFIVGTVNMDETTNQFSRKVLDRAFTIEMTDVDFTHFGNVTKPSYGDILEESTIAELLKGEASITSLDDEDKAKDSSLIKIQKSLEPTPFAIAYRFANEYTLLKRAIKTFDAENKFKLDALDQAVLMKILPRIAGESDYIKKIYDGLKTALVGKDASIKKINEIANRVEAAGSQYITFWP